MLTIKKLTADAAELPALTALYRAAFPENERRPLEPLLCDVAGHAEVLAFAEDGAFCGFAALLDCGGLSHIIYFAVAESRRGQGLGTQALAAMCARKAGMRVLVDIERSRADAPNRVQRLRRRRFYLRAGFAPTPVRYAWSGDDYEILSYGGSVTPEEFGRFWETLERDNAPLGQY